MLLYTFFGRSIEFYAGIQLALWYRRGQLPIYKMRGLLTVLGLIVMAVALTGMVWTRGGYTFGQEHPFGVALNNVMLPGGILLFFAGLLTEDTWLRRVLSCAPAQLLGKSSYAFYLIHLGIIRNWLAENLTAHNGLLFVLLNLLAIALYVGVEKPVNQWFRRRAKPIPLQVQPA
ncbi:hypothetical protein HMJ29_13410 [Hymenobacter taeanensis]|uniref:Acyltransferase n=1 Tax=Hymenobacter taeanensis TaxID=2735321 RepID=A0A6M6BLC6_9BACT|nr:MULTISPECIES: hypothetical protein [Hymenobacter]QJX47885.1 hypothetical protein HMJ29_13410 [Hymenobacter taeanensis]UOQ82673.1 hypothetical protein MUN83_07910 [Hymenobacter sp. 5414T-23]